MINSCFDNLIKCCAPFFFCLRWIIKSTTGVILPIWKSSTCVGYRLFSFDLVIYIIGTPICSKVFHLNHRINNENYGNAVGLDCKHWHRCKNRKIMTDNRRQPKDLTSKIVLFTVYPVLCLNVWKSNKCRAYGIIRNEKYFCAFYPAERMKWLW